MIYWLFLVASVVVASFSQILLKKSAAKKYDNVIKEYLNPYVIIGYAMMVGTTVLTILAYHGIEYKNGPVIESLGYILIMILHHIGAKFILKKDIIKWMAKKHYVSQERDILLEVVTDSVAKIRWLLLRQ